MHVNKHVKAHFTHVGIEHLEHLQLLPFIQSPPPLPVSVRTPNTLFSLVQQSQ